MNDIFDNSEDTDQSGEKNDFQDKEDSSESKDETGRINIVNSETLEILIDELIEKSNLRKP